MAKFDLGASGAERIELMGAMKNGN